VAVAGWEARNHFEHAQGSVRAAQTLVLGSWPESHEAWKYQLVDPHQRAIWNHIGDEMNLIDENPRQGLAAIVDRMSADPGHYAVWYLLQKPCWLWDWDIRFGAGGVNYLDTVNSPLDRSALLHAIQSLQQFGNPALVALAVLGIFFLGRSPYGVPLAIFFVYATAIHDILQAEPRYSIPYKSVEILLAVGAVAFGWQALSRNVQRYRAMREPERSLSREG
jgi:hypothetical protein